MTSTIRKAHAPSVAAALHRAGIVTTPSTREGVHVRRSLDDVLVAIDLDSARATRVLTELVVEALAAAGYATRPHPTEAHLVYVVGGARKSVAVPDAEVELIAAEIRAARGAL